MAVNVSSLANWPEIIAKESMQGGRSGLAARAQGYVPSRDRGVSPMPATLVAARREPSGCSE